MENSSRRLFLQSAGLLVMAGIPCSLFGRIVPESVSTDGTSTYVIRIDDYPQLKTVGGSVKLVSDEQLKLNPDHVANHDYSKVPPRGRYPIAVTRVAESGAKAFTAVSTMCTHGGGFQLADYDPAAGGFVCPHRGSTFTAAGTFIEKEGAPRNLDNLRTFPAVFDEATGTITLTVGG